MKLNVLFDKLHGSQTSINGFTRFVAKEKVKPKSIAIFAMIEKESGY